MAKFLLPRVQETIDYKQYIEEINIGFEYKETYGNTYIQVSYTIFVNEVFENLAYNEKESLFNQTPDYNFSLSTNQSRYDKKREMLRILEFRHIYESLASYAVLQFEKHLDPAIAIKVKGIDMWPEVNYAEKYLSEDLQITKRNDTYFNFEVDVSQWSRLHQLAIKSRKIYAKEKQQFNITDIEINQSFSLELSSIRYLLLKNEVPVKIRGTKTIDKIRIHTAKLVLALKKEINDERGYQYHDNEYKRLITYLYNRYLPAERIEIVKHQQSEYLKHFVIQQGDILQLKNMRVVVANVVSMDQGNAINVEYGILKTNLQLGERTRVIGTNDILFVLKKHLFLEFMGQTLVKHLSLLEKWMLKRKIKLDFTPFKPDLTKEIDTSAEK